MGKMKNIKSRLRPRAARSKPKIKRKLLDVNKVLLSKKPINYLSQAFQLLPVDTIGEVYSFLPAKDILNITLSGKGAMDLLHLSSHGWREVFIRDLANNNRTIESRLRKIYPNYLRNIKQIFSSFYWLNLCVYLSKLRFDIQHSLKYRFKLIVESIFEGCPNKESFMKALEDKDNPKINELCLSSFLDFETIKKNFNNKNEFVEFFKRLMKDLNIDFKKLETDIDLSMNLELIDRNEFFNDNDRVIVNDNKIILIVKNL